MKNLIWALGCSFSIAIGSMASGTERIKEALINKIANSSAEHFHVYDGNAIFFDDDAVMDKSQVLGLVNSEFNFEFANYQVLSTGPAYFTAAKTGTYPNLIIEEVTPELAAKILRERIASRKLPSDVSWYIEILAESLGCGTFDFNLDDPHLKAAALEQATRQLRIMVGAQRILANDVALYVGTLLKNSHCGTYQTTNFMGLGR